MSNQIQKANLSVLSENNGERLDKVVPSQLEEISRRQFRKILSLGGVFVNGKRVKVASRVLNTGDNIQIEYYSGETVQDYSSKSDLSLKEEQILFEDSSLLVINKPSGVPVQPTRQQDVYHIAKMAKNYLGKLGHNANSQKLQIINRLDKGTSGVMLLARDPYQISWLMDQFKEKKVKKCYLALTSGNAAAAAGRKTLIDQPLGRFHPEQRRVKINHLHGRPSVTEFEVIDFNEAFNIALIACYPKTGRTHQIRAHIGELQQSIVGDPIYKDFSNPKAADLVKSHLESGQFFLHSFALGLVTLPNSESQTFEATLPDYFRAACAELGFKIPSSLGRA